MRISGWCADVCSSDLGGRAFAGRARGRSLAAGPAAPARRGVGLLLATTRAALLADAAFVVDRGPGALLGLVLAQAANAVALFDLLGRSEEGRVGKEDVSTCQSWWSAYH